MMISPEVTLQLSERKVLVYPVTIYAVTIYAVAIYAVTTFNKNYLSNVNDSSQLCNLPSLSLQPFTE